MVRIHVDKIRASRRDSDSARRKLVAKSVKDSTSTTYKSAMASFTKLLTALRDKTTPVDPLSLTKGELLLILDELHEQDVGCAGVFVSALKKMSASEGRPLPFLYDEETKAAVKAVKKNAKGKVLPCGTLDEAQIDALKAHLTNASLTEYFYAVVVAVRARLRIGELGNVKRSDLSTAGGVAFLRLHKWKQGDTDINPEPKIVPGSLSIVFDAIARRRFGSDGFLFSKGIDQRLRQNMPLWAKALSWDTRLRFSGPHVFRHSGTGLLHENLRDRIGDAVLQLFAKQSCTTLAHYSTSASERLGQKRPRN